VRLLAETTPERPAIGLGHWVGARIGHTGTAPAEANGAASQKEQDEGDESEPEAGTSDSLCAHASEMVGNLVADERQESNINEEGDERNESGEEGEERGDER